MILKAITLFVTWMLLISLAVLFAISFTFFQVEGMFWYGIGLIISGVLFKTSVDWFIRE